MKLKYIGKGSLKSQGHTFNANEVYELLKDTYEYMLATFPSAFEVVEAPKEVEVKEVEPKEEVVRETKSKFTKRAVAPKE